MATLKAELRQMKKAVAGAAPLKRVTFWDCFLGLADPADLSGIDAEHWADLQAATSAPPRPTLEEETDLPRAEGV
jgi:hypothetical protein